MRVALFSCCCCFVVLLLAAHRRPKLIMMMMMSAQWCQTFLSRSSVNSLSVLAVRKNGKPN